jgi:hypothetical protein
MPILSYKPSQPPVPSILPASSFEINSPDFELIRIQTETQRTLLRPLHPHARLLSLLGRIDLLHQLHGEVHGGVEHDQQTVLDACAEGCGRHVRSLRLAKKGTRRIGIYGIVYDWRMDVFFCIFGWLALFFRTVQVPSDLYEFEILGAARGDGGERGDLYDIEGGRRDFLSLREPCNEQQLARVQRLERCKKKRSWDICIKRCRRSAGMHACKNDSRHYTANAENVYHCRLHAPSHAIVNLSNPTASG